MGLFGNIFKKKNASQDAAGIQFDGQEEFLKEKEEKAAGLKSKTAAKAPAKTAPKAEKKDTSVKSDTAAKTEEKKEEKTEEKKAAPKSAPKANADAEEKKTPAKAPLKKEEAKKEVKKEEIKKEEEKKDEAKPEPAASKSKPKAAKAQMPKEEPAEAVLASADAEDSDSETVTVSKITRNGNFDIKRAKDGRFYFNLYASNRARIASSQIYSSSTSAINGIKSVIANAGKAPIEDTTLQKPVSQPFPKWEIYIDKAGEYRFRLYASNGSCICHSHGYSTKQTCKGGIESIIRFAAEAEINKKYIK